MGGMKKKNRIIDFELNLKKMAEDELRGAVLRALLDNKITTKEIYGYVSEILAKNNRRLYMQTLHAVLRKMERDGIVEVKTVNHPRVTNYYYLSARARALLKKLFDENY